VKKKTLPIISRCTTEKRDYTNIVTISGRGQGAQSGFQYEKSGMSLLGGSTLASQRLCLTDRVIFFLWVLFRQFTKYEYRAILLGWSDERMGAACRARERWEIYTKFWPKCLKGNDHKGTSSTALRTEQ